MSSVLVKLISIVVLICLGYLGGEGLFDFGLGGLFCLKIDYDRYPIFDLSIMVVR